METRTNNQQNQQPPNQNHNQIEVAVASEDNRKSEVVTEIVDLKDKLPQLFLVAIVDPGFCCQPRRRSIGFDTFLSCTRKEALKLSEVAKWQFLPAPLKACKTPILKCNFQNACQVDLHVAHLYVLQNCPEVEPYLEELNTTTSDAQLNQDISSNFPTWFKQYYQLVEVRQSKRYTKTYDLFIFAQQAEQVYYTTYPEGHRGWLAVMKTKACSRITDNIVSETEQEAPYQDDELLELQVLEVDADVINESLVNVDGGGEEIDAYLLKQLDLVEPGEDECILSENDIENRGRGGGCRTFNRGTRRGFSLGAPITTNPSPSSIHISISESMVHVVAQTPNTLPTAQDQPNPTFVRESILTTPVRDVSPSAPDDSVTPEYPPDPNCEHIVDERPFIRAYKG
ncbi:hypothetical protein HKD37_09G025897 [Glycine soja]